MPLVIFHANNLNLSKLSPKLPELSAQSWPTCTLDFVITAHLQKEAIYVEFKSGCLVYKEGGGRILSL